MADITAKVFKYDPSVDDAPTFVTYEVDWVDDESGIMSALQVLHAVNEQEQLGYDWCCHSGLCNRCSMRVDGKAGLACWTPIEPGEHTFEPLAGFPVIRDLVVDKSDAYDKLVSVDVSIKTSSPMTTAKAIDFDLYWNTLERLNMCRECMCCYSVCPKIQEEGLGGRFVGPTAMMGIAQRYLDTEDESDRLAQSVYAGIFECDLCGECNKVCPAYIGIADIIAKMQEDAEARGLKPGETPYELY
ncbi:MAG: hypothetical protein HGA54_00305 [Actinobacteria bacterium]|nr:hypothetical protein [Actinomycetota bacterium]